MEKENPPLELQEWKDDRSRNENQPPAAYSTGLGQMFYFNPEEDRKRAELEREKTAARIEWDTRLESLLSLIGFAVGLGNFWRFPYLCYRHGGAVFLIPYLLMLFLIGMPLMYLELIIGQFHRRGCLGVWNTLCPLFKGVGFASCLISFYIAFYYNVIVSWAFYYFFSSFTANLPWASCENSWNTGNCWSGMAFLRTNFSEEPTSPAKEFFDVKVLGIHRSSGIDDLGGLKWDVTLCALLTFTFLFMALLKSVKTSGKVMYVTALTPYLMLIILLIRGALLYGAKEGIKYYLTPNISQLLQFETWFDAATQVFYSVGPGYGVYMTYASFNKFHNNVYRDMLITSIVNSVTSFLCGFVVFSYIGYLAWIRNLPIYEVMSVGSGLAFTVLPEALATLPGSTFWALIFFIMLLTLGLGSSIGGMETLLTGLQDELHWLLKRWKYGRQVFSFIVIYVTFLVGLSCTTYGGVFVITLMDVHSAGPSLFVAVFLEIVAASWLYGIEQLCCDVQSMMNFRPGIYWRICWKLLTPIIIFFLTILGFIRHFPLTYEYYSYPVWANALGWLFCFSAILIIPIYAMFKYLKAHGSLDQRLALCITPEHEHEAMKQTRAVKRFQVRHWISI